jgi:hypothetical protein
MIKTIFWAAALALSGSLAAAPSSLRQSLDIAKVPSAFPVGFCLLTHSNRQYVAYYDAQHQMTVTSRRLDQTNWTYQPLPTKIGWDSHNYVTMALDDDGQLHLAGNMHCVPLVYFRTTQAGDITSFQRVTNMVGQKEDRCTYPHFMRGPNRELIFHYRYGSSGNGVEIYNVYDLKTRAWRRFLDQPLTDGEGDRNAYMQGPELGPDGYFHLAWVWRDTPDCASNHDLSYARSRDLQHWESAAGRPLTLPIRFGTPDVLVDPVPTHGGIVNGCQKIGFDAQKRVLISYHKFDAAGKTQAYLARQENGRWLSVPVSRWDYRWELQGGGSIVSEIRLGAVKAGAPGTVELPFSHSKHGSGRLVVSEKDWQLQRVLPPERPWPSQHDRPELDFPQMRTQWARDVGQAPDQGGFYMLRWEALPPNRDRPREGPLPPDSPLRLLQFQLGVPR